MPKDLTVLKLIQQQDWYLNKYFPWKVQKIQQALLWYDLNVHIPLIIYLAMI